MQALHVLLQERSQAWSDPHPPEWGKEGRNYKFIYYASYSLPVLSLAKSLQLMEIRATYKLVSYLLAD